GEGPGAGFAGSSPGPSPDASLGPVAARIESFRSALADDFNTPRAIAQVFELVGEANRGDVPGREAAEALAEMLALVGLSSLTQPDKGAKADEGAGKLLEEREAARAEKDFARADEIREELASLGWEVRDSAEGAKLVPRG
ncbi:MAG TPA: DALR domain-containing protein, partial [Solirubrobacterales bacterium]